MRPYSIADGKVLLEEADTLADARALSRALFKRFTHLNYLDIFFGEVHVETRKAVRT